MKRLVPSRRLARVLPVLALLAAGRLAAQDAAFEEPRWLRLRVPETSLGFEAEGLKENVDLKGSGSSSHEYLSLTPLVGAHVQGSVYHPNLLSFDINGEGGYGWATDVITSDGFKQTRHEAQELIRYLAQVNLFSAKPYNASFFASQDHTYQNYDFFNTATVDSLRYGGRVAWTTKAFSFTADMGYRDEKSDSITGVSEIADTYFNFNGINHRDGGNTTLSYNYDNYDNTLNSGETQTSVNHSVAVSDSETFGSHDQITATTGANYSRYEYFTEHIETLNANENVTIKHTPNLDSFYSVNYNHNSQEPATSEVLQGMGGVRHRLYESLNSEFDVHGTYDDSSSPSGSSSNDRYGVGLNETYAKRTGSWGRLTIGGGLVADHEDHDNSGGNIVTVIDEPHALFFNRPATLNNPRVIPGTIRVVGPNGIPVSEGLDYRIVTTGQLTELWRIQGSTVLRDGDTVLVSYEAESAYRASFESLNGSAQIRLDILNTFGVYGRLNWLGNNAPPQAVVEDLLDLVGGADVNWRWLRAGAEYEDFDSNFSKYKAWRFFETFTFQPAEGSTLGVDLNQIFYRYPDDQKDTLYQFMVHLDTQLTPWLWWNVEGGYSRQEAFGTDQDLGAARTGLRFRWGKLNIQAGYQYNYQLTEQQIASEQRDRNFFYVHLRRTF